MFLELSWTSRKFVTNLVREGGYFLKALNYRLLLKSLPWWLSQWWICLQYWRPVFDSCRMEWQHTPVFLPGECHGQSSVTGYSSWGHKEWLTHTHLKALQGKIKDIDLVFKWDFSSYSAQHMPQLTLRTSLGFIQFEHSVLN